MRVLVKRIETNLRSYRAQERVHVKPCLVRHVAELRPHGARPARKTAALAAVSAGGTQHMVDAGVQIE